MNGSPWLGAFAHFLQFMGPIICHCSRRPQATLTAGVDSSKAIGLEKMLATALVMLLQPDPTRIADPYFLNSSSSGLDFSWGLTAALRLVNSSSMLSR